MAYRSAPSLLVAFISVMSIGTGADNDVVNHSIIIHAEAGGGTRIACGVIAKD